MIYLIKMKKVLLFLIIKEIKKVKNKSKYLVIILSLIFPKLVFSSSPNFWGGNGVELIPVYPNSNEKGYKVVSNLTSEQKAVFLTELAKKYYDEYDIYIIPSSGAYKNIRIKILPEYKNYEEMDFWWRVCHPWPWLFGDYYVKIELPNGEKGWCNVGKDWQDNIIYLLPKKSSCVVYLWEEIDLPEREKKIIEEVANEYGLEGEDRLLLYIIRKVENGEPGFEFGVKAVKGTDFRTQAEWAAASIVKNRERYKGWLAKGHSGDFLYFFAYYGGPTGKGWAPIEGVSEEERRINLNWYPNAKYYMDKWTRKA